MKTGMWLIVVLMLTSVSFATTVSVGGCVTGVTNYTTIQAAINASLPGDTVDVCPGTYSEALTITIPLTVVGVQSGFGDRAIVQGVFNSASVTIPGGQYGFRVQPSSNTVFPQILIQNTGPVNLTNLTVDGNGGGLDTVGVYYQNSSGTVNHVAEHGGHSFGFWLENDTATLLNVTVTNSVVSSRIVSFSSSSTLSVVSSGNDLSSGDVTFYAYQTTGTLSSNAIRFAAYGILIDFGSSFSVAQNTIVSQGGESKIRLGSAGNSVTNNYLSGGMEVAGIVLDPGANNNTISKNTVRFGRLGGTMGTAISFDCGLTGNTVKNNTVEDQTIGIAHVPLSGNVVGPNMFFNADTVTTSCP